MPLYSHFVYAFIGTIGFSILFNCPKKSLFYGGLTGGLGWTFYIFLKELTLHAVFANFTAAVLIGILGEIFARIDRKPVTVFIIPGIVPLVPGYGMYLTMVDLINNRLTSAATNAINTIFTSISIAMGVIIISAVAKVFKTLNSNRKARLKLKKEKLLMTKKL